MFSRWSRVAYPPARRAATSYCLHGDSIADPYAWLESPDGPEAQAFVAGQQALFDKVVPPEGARERLHEAVRRTLRYARAGAPSRPIGGFSYFFHNSGLQNQSVLLRSRVPDGAAVAPANAPTEVFIDPNTWSEDATIAMGTTAWSGTDRFFAYTVAEKGSDWHTIRFRRMHHDTGLFDDMPEVVRWVKYSGLAWLGDIGVFYTRYPPVETADLGTEGTEALNAEVYFHRVGTDPSADVSVFKTPQEPRWMAHIAASDCEKYLVATVSDGCEPKNLIHVARVTDAFLDFASGKCDLPPANALTFKPLVSSWEAEYEFLGNDGPQLYFITTAGAPRKCVVAIDVDTGSRTVAVGEQEHVLSHALIVRDELYLVHTEHAQDALRHRPLRNAEAPLARVDLPLGTIAALSGDRTKSDVVSIKVTSFILPGRSFYITASEAPLIAHRVRDDTVEGFDPDAFTAEQVFVERPAAGGCEAVRVPMFVMRRRGTDGPRPMLLYAYGGFNISLTPTFSATRLVLMNNLGFSLAVANIRGGGEYGQPWHDAGRRANKENCFDDFVACADWLSTHRFTDPARLVAMGGSNGGLLVAAAANRAPRAFAAVICQVGVLDMFRFHKFTIGHAWRSDFGDPDVEADYRVLKRYSPLHNISTDGPFPAVLVVTADHDDRVVPMHSLKYLATLQHARGGGEGGPFVGLIETAAGHSAGKPLSKTIAETAAMWAFASQAVGVDVS